MTLKDSVCNDCRYAHSGVSFAICPKCKSHNVETLVEICSSSELPSPEKSALDIQIGGDHYKNMKIQPMEYSMANGLDACQHTAIKYISRFRSRGGKEDLDKAIHCIKMLKEFEYGDD